VYPDYGRHTVYTDGFTRYPKARKVLKLKHFAHSSMEKSIIERVNHYFKDRTESFDDYYPRSKKDKECNLDHVYKCITGENYLYQCTIIQ
jgi:putative transposase